MIGLVLADLRRHAAGVVAVVVLLALAGALGVVVTLQERALRLGSARAAAAFDLVIGAPGGETQLVLSTVFLQPAPLTLVPLAVLDALKGDPRVAWAAPVGFGDFAGDNPIVGTTPDLVRALGGVASGTAMADEHDALVGADVAIAVGATLHPMHGEASLGGHAHTGITYTVVGRLARSGTAFDRAMLVPIAAVFHVHGMDDDGDDHDDAPPGGRERAIGTLVGHDVVPRPAGVPAIIVKPRTVADAYRLRQQYRTERTLAVFPAEVLTRLYGTLGDARGVLALVAAGAQALVGAAVLLVVVAHVLTRRRQIGALRAVGVPRGAVFLLVWIESMTIVVLGLALGVAVGYGAARVIAARIGPDVGFPLPIGFVAGDLASLAMLLACGAVAAGVPAALAFRQSPAAALRA